MLVTALSMCANVSQKEREREECVCVCVCMCVCVCAEGSLLFTVSWFEIVGR